MCPALILANNRKHKVIGRTMILINSTNLRKGIKYQGVFTGNRLEATINFTSCNRTLDNHKHKAILKLNPKVVVTG